MTVSKMKCPHCANQFHVEISHDIPMEIIKRRPTAMIDPVARTVGFVTKQGTKAFKAIKKVFK